MPAGAIYEDSAALGVLLVWVRLHSRFADKLCVHLHYLATDMRLATDAQQTIAMQATTNVCVWLWQGQLKCMQMKFVLVDCLFLLVP